MYRKEYNMARYNEFNNETEYLDALWEAHIDGECSSFLQYKPYRCTYCETENDARIFEEQKAIEHGHDYSVSDHCAHCGAEQFESAEYFTTCKGRD